MNTYSNPRKSSTSNLPSREKSFAGASSHVRTHGPIGPWDFKSFIQSQRVMPSRRGNLIDIYKTLIAADAFPTINAWSDLYGLMCSRSADDDAIALARQVWREFQKQNVPLAKPERDMQ
jgi:hypothetical protein